METYRGQVKTPNDAIILFEACRLGNLPRVQRRLSEKERQSIGSGSVFVWDEREAGMRRWTDGKSWSASRVSGSFLTYREMEGRRGGSAYNSPATGTGLSNGVDAMDTGGDAPDGYRYKPDGLVKQSFSITTSTGQHLHLISYFARSHPESGRLPTPSTDPSLAHIRPEKGMYPEATVSEAPDKPAITRSPMGYSPFASSPSQPQSNHYLRHAPPNNPNGYGWSSSALSSPPLNHSAYLSGSLFPPGNYPPSNSAAPLFQHQAYTPTSAAPAGQTAFDRAPPQMRGNGIPPPPPPAPSQSYPQHQPPYAHQAATTTPPPFSASRPQDLPRDIRQPEHPTSHPRERNAIAPRSPYSSHSDRRHEPLYPQASPMRTPPIATTHTDGNRSSLFWNADKPNGVSAEDNKRIPSINSLMNKSPPPPHHLSLASGSSQNRDGASSYTSGRSEGTSGDRQLSGVKDLGAGKAFGEDSRALRKLDKAFAM